MVVALAVGAVSASSASAGTYTVNSCAFPDGTPAGTSGWRVDAWASMRMTFTAAAYTTIVSYKVWRSVRIGAGTAYFYTAFD